MLAGPLVGVADFGAPALAVAELILELAFY